MIVDARMVFLGYRKETKAVSNKAYLHGHYMKYTSTKFQIYIFTFTLHLSHLADALIQSDLQIGAFTL
jgi:hypothetical protein